MLVLRLTEKIHFKSAIKKIIRAIFGLDRSAGDQNRKWPKDFISPLKISATENNFAGQNSCLKRNYFTIINSESFSELNVSKIAK